MIKVIKRSFSIILLVTLLIMPVSSLAQNEASTVLRFTDVPEGHWSYNAIQDFRAKDITQGIGNNKFGFGSNIKRDEFVTFLIRLMGWELINPEQASFIDCADKTSWYYKYIETAVQHGVILKDSESFRPEDNITREDLAVMIVRSMGYDSLAQQLGASVKPFSDVQNYPGYIAIVKDFGIVTGKSGSTFGGSTFAPEDMAKKEEAVVIMMRMYEKLNSSIKTLHAFYAQSSYNQMDLIPNFDCVSFGWSHLNYDTKNDQVELNMTEQNDNGFILPEGFSEPVKLAQKDKIPSQLCVYASQFTTAPDNMGLVEFVITNPEVRKHVIESIIQKVNSTEQNSEKISFDGVTIDFENLSGKALRQNFNTFLSELKSELEKYNKKLYVTVQPEMKTGQAYFDGYDFKGIGDIADMVILMAHDYNATQLTESEMNTGYNDTPLTPFEQVYYSLKAITDKQTGVSDLSKILLQVSFGSAQWKMLNGKVINQAAFTPAYDKIKDRLYNLDGMENLIMHYSSSLQNPWVTYRNTNDNTDNIIWYEDSRSIQAKIELAKMFGVQGVSLWRLGNIPAYEENSEKQIYLDIWQHILQQTKN